MIDERHLPTDVSPRVREMLLRSGATKRQGPAPSSEAVLAALETKGLPTYPPLVDCYQRFGGLTWPIVNLPTGAYDLADLPDLAAKDQEHDRYLTDGGETLVVVGILYPMSDLHMGADGAIVDVTCRKEEGQSDDDCLLPFATSIQMLLEQAAMLQAAEAMPKHRIQLDFRGVPRGVFGEVLARALGAEPVPEASDALQRWWEAPGLLVLEGHIPRSMLDEVTRAYAAGLDEAAAALLALKSAGARARVTISARQGAPVLPEGEPGDDTIPPVAKVDYADWRRGIHGHVRLFGSEGAYSIEQTRGVTWDDGTTWKRFTREGIQRREKLPRLTGFEDD